MKNWQRIGGRVTDKYIKCKGMHLVAGMERMAGATVFALNALHCLKRFYFNMPIQMVAW